MSGYRAVVSSKFAVGDFLLFIYAHVVENRFMVVTASEMRAVTEFVEIYSFLFRRSLRSCGPGWKLLEDLLRLREDRNNNYSD